MKRLNFLLVLPVVAMCVFSCSKDTETVYVDKPWDELIANQTDLMNDDLFGKVKSYEEVYYNNSKIVDSKLVDGVKSYSYNYEYDEAGFLVKRTSLTNVPTEIVYTKDGKGREVLVIKKREWKTQTVYVTERDELNRMKVLKQTDNKQYECLVKNTNNGDVDLLSYSRNTDTIVLANYSILKGSVLNIVATDYPLNKWSATYDNKNYTATIIESTSTDKGVTFKDVTKTEYPLNKFYKIDDDSAYKEYDLKEPEAPEAKSAPSYEQILVKDNTGNVTLRYSIDYSRAKNADGSFYVNNHYVCTYTYY